jgi:hypothetical protein
MPRVNKDGKHILSAGEIGIYTICPESWRLRVIKGLRRTESHEIDLGNQLHQEWAQATEDVNLLVNGLKALLILIVLAILVAIFHFYNLSF